jgi:pimeloyl-[acyl-carrier protein] methyl ester esterase
MKLLLLPGMDGTGLLFRQLVEALPKHIAPHVHAYDMQKRMGYDALLEALPRIDEPYAILGESFSGPLAIRRAAEDANVRAVILTASFERTPQALLRALAPVSRLLFASPPPRAVVRHVLLGPQANEARIEEVREAISRVRGEVLAHRLQQVAQVDVSRELQGLPCPLLYLQGAHDRLVPAACGRRIAVGRGRILHRLDAGHLLLQTQPSASAEAITTFLRDAP